MRRVFVVCVDLYGEGEDGDEDDDRGRTDGEKRRETGRVAALDEGWLILNIWRIILSVCRYVSWCS